MPVAIWLRNANMIWWYFIATFDECIYSIFYLLKSFLNKIDPPRAVLTSRCRLTSIGIPSIKIRRSWDRLTFIMGIPINEKDYLYIETWPLLYALVVIYVFTVMFCSPIWQPHAGDILELWSKWLKGSLDLQLGYLRPEWEDWPDSPGRAHTKPTSSVPLFQDFHN